MQSISVVIPALNEGDNLDRTVRNLHEMLPEASEIRPQSLSYVVVAFGLPQDDLTHAGMA